MEMKEGKYASVIIGIILVVVNMSLKLKENASSNTKLLQDAILMAIVEENSACTHTLIRTLLF